MTRDNSDRPRRFTLAPAIETLEDRKLLSQFFSGPTPIRPVRTAGGVYTLTMNGPGLERVTPAGHGAVAITLLGTTQASSLDIALTRQLPHKPVTPLQIASIKVISGQIGGITAGNTATLLGSITPLNGQVNTLQFAGLGSNASIDVNGPLGSFGVTGNVALGPKGRVHIAGDLAQSLTVGGTLGIDGGVFVIDNNLSGSLTAASVNLTRGGRFVVGHDLTGSTQVAGNLSASGNGIFAVGHNLGGLNLTRSLILDSGGQVAVGNDVTGAFSVGEGLSVVNNSKISIGRDVTGNFTAGGDMALSGNGAVAIGRTLNALTVNGNLTVAPGGGNILVGGNLNTLTVNGALIGKGAPSTVPDLSVGLNLASLNVLGGGANQGGIQNASIDIGKSLLGVNVPHGIFNSIITAGVAIDGGQARGTTGNVGADGADAVYNSQIRAVVSITNLTFGGNVRSTFAVNPTTSPGYRTRIIAGESRQGDFTGSGTIDKFVINGQLIDAVIAAGVAPNGGNGTLPAGGYAPPPSTDTSTPGDLGNNTYDKPAGITTGGTVAAPIPYANFTELSYYNAKITNVAYSTTDRTIDDLILPGAINPSFAAVPLTAITSGTQILPLPTTSMVKGGVISTPHGDEADYAGIFAADTRGVFVGTLPP